MDLLFENWRKYLNEGDVVDLSSHPKYKVHQTKAERMRAADDLIEWGAKYLNSTRYDVTERHTDLARFAEKAEELGLNLGNEELQDFIDDSYTARGAYKEEPKKKPWWKFWSDKE